MSRRNPFEEIEDLFERLNSELNEVGRQLEGGLRGDVDVDVVEDDTEVRVVADLPGFDPDGIDVTVSGREVTVEASRETSVETDEGDEEVRYHRRERRRESITRRVHLPADVEEDQAAADYERGVLTVTLPKVTAEEASGTTIEVE